MEDSIDRLYAEWKSSQGHFDATSDAAEVISLAAEYIEQRKRLVERIGAEGSTVEGSWRYQVVDGEGRSQGCRWVIRRPIEERPTVKARRYSDPSELTEAIEENLRSRGMEDMIPSDDGLTHWVSQDWSGPETTSGDVDEWVGAWIEQCTDPQP